MHQQKTEVTLHGLELGQPHVLNLLNHMGPINIVNPFPTCETAQQVRLGFRPAKDILFVKIIRHKHFLLLLKVNGEEPISSWPGHEQAVTRARARPPGRSDRIRQRFPPGAARAHDPDGFGHVYHRAISAGPGLKAVDDPLRVTLDAAGDRAMTERFIAEVSETRKPAFGILWCVEPDHIQHNARPGSSEHLTVLRQADHHAGMVIGAVAKQRDAGEDILLIAASGHGHETVIGVIDVEADLIDAGLKYGPESTDVIAMANGTAVLIYPHLDAESRRASLDHHLRHAYWAGAVFGADELHWSVTRRIMASHSRFQCVPITK